MVVHPTASTPPMLEDSTKTTIRETLDALRKARPGMRLRRSQNVMIAAVARAVGHQDGQPSQLVIEAPTGTGKSLGYLLGAVYAAKARGKTVVISSATVALQEQLMGREIPALIADGGNAFTFKLAKGRLRYCCDWRLEQLAAHDLDQAALAFEEDSVTPWETAPSSTVMGAVTTLLAARLNKTWSGDLDAWPERIEPEVLGHITVQSSQCLGRVCPRASTCPMLIARQGVFSADVVVANHSLVLADLAAGGGAVLPDPEKTVYIFDEAHHLGHRAVSQFATSITPASLKNDIQRAKTSLAAAVRLIGLDARKAEYMQADLKHLLQVLDEPALFLTPLRPAYNTKAKSDETEILLEGEPLDRVAEWAEALKGPASGIQTLLEMILTELSQATKDGRVVPAVLGNLKARIGRLAERMSAVVALLHNLAYQPSEDEPPIAKWVAWPKSAHGMFTLCAAPVSAAHELRERLWSRADSVILTSATLSSLGSFDSLLDALGLDYDATTQLILPSPFQLDVQAELRITKGSGIASRSSQHTREVTALVESAHAPQGGTLVLFCSHKQLQAVFLGLSPAVAKHVQCQGQASRDVLLKNHGDKVAAGEPSILFGVQQLSEGLYLAGDLCRVVIVAKLPFGLPDTPVARTVEAWIQRRGGNYFDEVVLHEAHRRLTQMLGRLVRTEHDTGVLYVADDRLSKTRYGKRMLETLPPYRRAG